MHDLRLIHTDLKPENILLVSPDYIKVPDYKSSSRSLIDSSYFKRVPKSCAIKVIDFGSTTYERQDQNYNVSTRHYRAPEVILGLGWSYPCDVWSVGCILVELCTGEALFQTHENLEHLAMMERVLGPFPQKMLKRVDRHAEKYVRRGRLDWPDGATSRESIKAVTKLPRLQNLIMQHADHSAGDLILLLQGFLRYDPSDRLTAREALRHPFFTSDHLRRSLAACELLYNAGYRNLFWVQGGLDAAEEEDLVREGPQPLKFAGIGGVSEFLGWTDQQRAAAAKEGWGYQLMFSARLVGVFLVADTLFIGAQQVGRYLQDIRSH